MGSGLEFGVGDARREAAKNRFGLFGFSVASPYVLYFVFCMWACGHVGPWPVIFGCFVDKVLNLAASPFSICFTRR